MSYNRSWLESAGSEDCQGRALWALGACVHRSKRRDLLLGVRLYAWLCRPCSRRPRPGPGHLACSASAIISSGSAVPPASQIRDTLTDRLIESFERTATDEWCWFEEYLTYDNARLCQGLIASGQSGGHAQALDIGLKTLSWLVGQQKAPAGHFRPIGSEGFYHRGRERASSTSSRWRPVPSFRPASAPSRPLRTRSG